MNITKIIAEELNVKEVVLGADMKDYVSFEIKPNLPVLGKEYGRLFRRAVCGVCR